MEGINLAYEFENGVKIKIVCVKTLICYISYICTGLDYLFDVCDMLSSSTVKSKTFSMQTFLS